MSHSFVKIWFHAIWSTKERESLIIPSVEKGFTNICVANLWIGDRGKVIIKKDNFSKSREKIIKNDDKKSSTHILNLQ